MDIGVNISEVISDIKSEDIIFLKKSKLREGTVWLSDSGGVHSLNSHKISTTNIYFEFINPIDKVSDYHILVNFSNKSVPGSENNQKELYLRSNLIFSLYSFIPELGKLFEFENGLRYPLKNFELIYSPRVSIYRNSNLEIIDKQYNCDIITLLELKEFKIELQKEQLRNLFRFCVFKSKHKVIIPADWVFNDVNYHYSNLYYEVLSEPEFYQKFSEICFAINPLWQSEMVFIDKFEIYIN